MGCRQAFLILATRIAGVRRRLVAAAACAVIAVQGSACNQLACPATLAAARDPDFVDSLPPQTVVGIARVQRFVDSPHLHARGYDLGFLTVDMGDPSPVVTFLRVERTPTIDSGDRVLVVARQESEHTLFPVGCPLVELAPA